MSDKSKFSLKPFGQGATYKSTPTKDVKVKGKSAYAGLRGEYKNEKKGLTISASVAKNFDAGKVNFPGGSESWNVDSKPDFKIEIKKTFGGPKNNKDLSKIVENKSTGGMMDYYKDIL